MQKITPCLWFDNQSDDSISLLVNFETQEEVLAMMKIDLTIIHQVYEQRLPEDGVAIRR